MTTNTENFDPMKMPQKKYYRSRAHCNPLSHNDGFTYPMSPDLYNWKIHYPNIDNPVVQFVDVGCGFGGLTVALSELYPNKIVLGLEIRSKVCEYVRLRIDSLRLQNGGNAFQNASCLRTNSMRYFPNFIMKGQLEKMFFCFPDPHFKAKNHRRRIVNETLLTEYSYLLQENGQLYCITDVEELHEWHVEKCSNHPAFERITDEDILHNDPAVKAMLETTEEGKKVERMGGKKFYAVFRRRRNEEFIKPAILDLFDTIQV